MHLLLYGILARGEEAVRRIIAVKQIEPAEMFDKYNLHALPVVDPQGRMVGVVRAEQVISFLRERL
jgi:Mg/Co/Ni transporter MgtE